MRVPSRAAVSPAPLPGVRRGLLGALLVAWALVILRSAVYLAYEQSFFDSDQAVFGLMAKHLSEGRAFPLFQYGETYMLVVDAWLAVPWFWIMGPTVAALHSSLVMSNLVAVTLLVVTLHLACGLRPLLAVLVSLPFAFAPPLVAASLIEAAGSIGPFMYVPLLWLLRRRPLWFGCVLAFGFLHREFTIYAVPVLVVIEIWQRTLWRPERVRFWLLASAAGAGTWQFVQSLKPFADMMGPGTRGELVRGYGGSQVGNIADRMSLTPSEMPGRLTAMIVDHLPRLYGAKALREPIAAQGHDWLFWPLAIGLTFALLRALWLLAESSRVGHLSDPSGLSHLTGPIAPRRLVEVTSSRFLGPHEPVEPEIPVAPVAPVAPEFAFYLTGVGALAILTYIATRPVGSVVDRYLLLSLYFPIGVLALFFYAEGRRWLRRAVVALMLVWACASATDHWRQLVRYRSGREANSMRVLADGLVARHIHVAMATYWRAYKITFLTREQVKVASSDYVRIEEYQRLAALAGDSLLTIQEAPCAGAERIGDWYLCR